MTQQQDWFIKECKSISLRNLSYENMERLLSPYLHITDSGNSSPKIIFKSPSQQSTCNPTWTLTVFKSPSAAVTLSCLTNKEVRVCVFNDNDDYTAATKQPIQVFNINFQTLCQLGDRDLKLYSPELASLPLNTILLATDTNLFTTEKIFQKIKSSGLISSSKLTQTSQPSSSGYDDATAFALYNIRESLISSNSKISKKSDEIIKLYYNSDKSRKVAMANAKLIELDKLRAEFERVGSDADAEEKLEAREWNQLRVTRDLRTEVDLCDKLVESITELNESIPNQKDDLMKLQFMMESRRTRLIADLRDIYPIEKINGEFLIRGLELNEFSISQKDDEAFSSALGYIVHLLVLLSKYLECPLRYQLLYYASRSMIRDPIANPALYGLASSSTLGVAVPLYRKGSEKDRVELAITWLRCDVEQILNCYKLNFQPQETLLGNMYYFFYHDT